MSGGGQGGTGVMGGGYGGGYGRQSFGGGNPWMRQGGIPQQRQANAFGDSFGGMAQPAITRSEPAALGDPSQFSNPGMATPQNSATTGIRGQASPPSWIAPPGGMGGPPAMQPSTQSFAGSPMFGNKMGQMSDGFQVSETQAPPTQAPQSSGVPGQYLPSWYNAQTGPAEHYDLRKFPWLAHINGPNSAPPPQGWNSAAPGTEAYRTIFNPNRGQQLYPNQPWMWPFAGASSSPLNR